MPVPEGRLDPVRVKGVLLDIDGTLYDSPEYVAFQNRVQIEAWAKEREVTYGEALADLAAFKARYAAENGGAATSLANSLEAFGVPIPRSVEMRKALLDPGRFLSPDPALSDAISRASKFVAICAVTNNPASVGELTLRALGICSGISFVVGLDDTMRSKPAPEPFLFALSRLGLPPDACLSVGDRHDVDLAVPLAMGMQGVLVSGPADVIDVLDAISALHQPSRRGFPA